MEYPSGYAHQQHGHADLQQDPHDNDDVAVDEERRSIVERPVLRVVGREPVDPSLPGREAEHSAQGPVEGVEAGRRGVAEDGDAHDRVCARAGCD